MAIRLELGPGTGCYVKNPKIVESSKIVGRSFNITTAKPGIDELAMLYLSWKTYMYNSSPCTTIV